MDLSMKLQELNTNMERSRNLALEARVAELEVKVKSLEERLNKAEEQISNISYELYSEMDRR